MGKTIVGPRAKLMALRYAGVCASCNRRVARSERAWFDLDSRKITCSTCEPISPIPVPELRGAELFVMDASGDPPSPVGGSSALPESVKRGDLSWQKGAVGEYLMARYLEKHLSADEVVLHDRSIPNSGGNIGHLVVASSGVWVIDAKNWKGRIEFRNVGKRLDERRRLYVDDQDRTSKVEALYRQIIPVANVVSDPAVDINPALVFVGEDWTGIPTTRLLTSTPYRYLGVWVTWPKALVKKIRKPGPLSSEAVGDLAKKLDSALRPR